MATNTPPSSGKARLSSIVHVMDSIRREKGGRAIGRGGGGRAKGALAEASAETPKDRPDRDIQHGATSPLTPLPDSSPAVPNQPKWPRLVDRETVLQAVRSHFATMAGADVSGWNEVVTGAAATEFKRIRPLDYTFVFKDDGHFLGRVEVHFVQTLTDDAWPEPFRIGQWLPARVRGYVGDDGDVRIEHAELTRTDC
mgnify:CR=1 FL=1